MSIARLPVQLRLEKNSNDNKNKNKNKIAREAQEGSASCEQGGGNTAILIPYPPSQENTLFVPQVDPYLNKPSSGTHVTRSSCFLWPQATSFLVYTRTQTGLLTTIAFPSLFCNRYFVQCLCTNKMNLNGRRLSSPATVTSTRPRALGGLKAPIWTTPSGDETSSPASPLALGSSVIEVLGLVLFRKGGEDVIACITSEKLKVHFSVTSTEVDFTS
ncbi:hypothetical protein EV401DRAFT_1892908 [Pisolithus croceorrhizus]|nr:hypothetical protein EV401DRAFT_1892908 [Pisolithus croceorrhizus]